MAPHFCSQRSSDYGSQTKAWPAWHPPGDCRRNLLSSSSGVFAESYSFMRPHCLVVLSCLELQSSPCKVNPYVSWQLLIKSFSGVEPSFSFNMSLFPTPFAKICQPSSQSPCDPSPHFGSITLKSLSSVSAYHNSQGRDQPVHRLWPTFHNCEHTVPKCASSPR